MINGHTNVKKKIAKTCLFKKQKLQKNGFLNIQSQLTIVSRVVKYQNLGLQHSSFVYLSLVHHITA